MTAAREPSADDLVAEHRVFGRYVIRYLVANGGMASVYLAQISGREGFQKWVAIKAIHPHLASNKKFVQMFLNEARLAARLDHPSICSVFDFGAENGTYYLAMEYLHGESLSALARRVWDQGGLPFELGARIVADAARGLHAAHELKAADGSPAGVVHRDVSPQNIFVLYDGMSKVVDFGIARSSDHLGEHTATGEVKGKVAYMAPEQLRNQTVDRRTDIFALGIVLWEITTGKRLFRRDTEVDSMLAVIQGEIPRPSSMRKGYPVALENIVMKALARETVDRYPSCAQFGRDIEGYLASTGIPAGHSEVGDFMNVLFADRKAQREDLLRRTATEANVPSIDSEPETSSLVLRAQPPGEPTPVHRPQSAQPEVAPTRVARVAPLDVEPTSVMPSEVSRPITHPVLPLPPPTPVLASARAKSRGTLAIVAGFTIGGVALAGVVAVVLSDHHPARAPSTADALSASAPVSHTALAPLQSAPALAAPALVPQPTPPVAAPTPAPSHTGRASHGSAHTGSAPAHHEEHSEPSGGTASTSGAPGFLDLIAMPSAPVFEGGHSLGYTPLSGQALSPGRHTLRLVPTDGRAPRTIVVNIRSGETEGQRVRW